MNWHSIHTGHIKHLADYDLVCSGCHEFKYVHTRHTTSISFFLRSGRRVSFFLRQLPLFNVLVLCSDSIILFSYSVCLRIHNKKKKKMKKTKRKQNKKKLLAVIVCLRFIVGSLSHSVTHALFSFSTLQCAPTSTHHFAARSLHLPRSQFYYYVCNAFSAL